jgi:hypothetical protein
MTCVILKLTKKTHKKLIKNNKMVMDEKKKQKKPRKLVSMSTL